MIVGGLGVALLALGNGESQQLVGACFLSLGAFAFASTLWLSMRADAKGVRVVNAFRVYRVPWNKVDLISSVQRERAFYAPGHVEIRRSGTWALPDGYSIKVGATAGLDDDARAVVVAALLAEARVHGFNPAQAAGRRWEIWRTPRPQEAAPDDIPGISRRRQNHPRYGSSAVAVELVAEIQPTAGVSDTPDGWRGLIDFGEEWSEADAALASPPGGEVPIGQPLIYGCEVTRDVDSPGRVRIRLFALEEPRVIMTPGAAFTLRDGRAARATGRLVSGTVG